MWAPLWPGTGEADVPIGHVTNGVHVPTWIGSPMREVLDRHLGPDWVRRADDPDRDLASIGDEQGADRGHGLTAYPSTSAMGWLMSFGCEVRKRTRQIPGTRSTASSSAGSPARVSGSR